MISLEDLYVHAEKLSDAKENATKNEDDYKAILSGLKSGPNEKRLASQFVARFFKYFPNLWHQSLEAMFDLCEDLDLTIRKQAIKDLPSLCKTNVDSCQKVSDILTQLLQSTDNLEISLVHMSLISLLRINAKSTLAAVFAQIIQGEESVREKAILFLLNKIKFIVTEELLIKDTEEFFILQCKKVLEDVTGTEFINFMKILTSLPSMSSLLGRQQLLDIIAEQANLTGKFAPTDIDSINCLIQCIKQAALLFSKNVHSHKFVEYLCIQVLPHLNEIPTNEEIDFKLEIIKLLSDMVIFCGPLENIKLSVAEVFNALLKYMPKPIDENDINDSIPKLQFSYVECLIYTFHQLVRRCPDFLIDTDNADRLKDFRIRLQFFARGVQGYIKSLKAIDPISKVDGDKEEENHLKTIALKTTNNINIIIKDLFHNPPSYKAVVVLSFKPNPTQSLTLAESKPGQKRVGITPVTFDLDNSSKKTKSEKTIYTPGKFSQNSASGWQNNKGHSFKKW